MHEQSGKYRNSSVCLYWCGFGGSQLVSLCDACETTETKHCLLSWVCSKSWNWSQSFHWLECSCYSNLVNGILISHSNKQQPRGSLKAVNPLLLLFDLHICLKCWTHSDSSTLYILTFRALTMLYHEPLSSQKFQCNLNWNLNCSWTNKAHEQFYLKVAVRTDKLLNT